jgi:predicted metalloprotease
MRWQDGPQSDNVEDRRRSGGGTMMVGGGIGTLLLVVVFALLGGDPQQLLQNLPQAQQQPGGGGNDRPLTAEEEEAGKFVRAVLGQTEQVWDAEFRKLGRGYQKPKLILFEGQVATGCGNASSAVGPFYCPADQQVYIDLSFFDEMRQKFHAPGDFAQAYVIAHEIGHHVQKLLGTSDKVHAARRGASEAEGNQLSVRLELQADFYAGVWAHHAQKAFNILEPGDMEEAIVAANAIGDDTLQKRFQRTVVPERFTHGTSEQRVRWFQRGFKSGDIRQGDTFSVNASEL